MKPYAIQTAPYHENGTVGFSLRELLGDYAGKRAGSDPDGFEVFYQDGRPSVCIAAADICVKQSPEYIREYLMELGRRPQHPISPDTPESYAMNNRRIYAMWDRWAAGEITDEEIETYRNRDEMVWFSPDELDAWEAANL